MSEIIKNTERQLPLTEQNDGFDIELSVVELEERHEMCWRCCGSDKSAS